MTVVWGLYFIANACSNTGKIFLSIETARL